MLPVMISVEEAKRSMLMQVPITSAELVTLENAAGRFTMATITSPTEHPLFDMSAVDGYAFLLKDDGPWHVVGEVPAGGVLEHPLRSGECARIFTGAKLPVGADTVVMQEFVSREDQQITHNDIRLKPGANVRRRGEQVRMGDVLLTAGSRMDPEAIGLLASVGIKQVEVCRSPKVTVLLTGNEFLEEGRAEEGKIHSSNGSMLVAALKGSGVEADALYARDDLQALDEAMQQALKSDVIISTGGVSVGDHDLVREAVERNGGKVHFHGVAQKPGKPMLFATFGQKVFFGLPGNPRAVMVLFWEYVWPFLRAMQGATEPWLPFDQLPLEGPLNVKGERGEFRAVRVRGGLVTLLKDEGSHMLKSLRQANAIAYIPAGTQALSVGMKVEVHYLPR